MARLKTLAALMLALPLVAHGVIGYFTRYLADDYCTAARLSQFGFLGAGRFWFMNWSGRLSFFFIIDMVQSLGAWPVKYLPAVILICWTAALCWALRSLCISLLIVFATLTFTPNIIQSLYWQTGSLTYLVPLIFGSVLSGLLVGRAGRSPLVSIGCLALAAVAGGCSDVYALIQTISLVGVSAFFWWQGDARYKDCLFALTGSAIALGVIIAAPGNAIRRAAYPAPPPLLLVIVLSVKYASYMIARAIYHAPLTAAALFILSAMLSAKRRPLALRNSLVAVVVAALLILGCLAPAFYTTSETLPERAQILPILILVMGIVFVGSQWGFPRIRSAYSTALVVILLALSPMWQTVTTLQRLPTVRAYAARWDREDQEIREAVRQGNHSFAIVNPSDYESRLGAITPDPSHWYNKCVEDYYNIPEVTAQTVEPRPH